MKANRPVIQMFSVLVLSLSCSRGAQVSSSSLSQVPDAKSSDLVKLGEMIFKDSRLSEPQGVSCASCHNPGRAFTGNNGSPVPGVAVGAVRDRFGSRNSPTSMYASFSPEFAFVPGESPGEFVATGGQFWDGRASTLAEQAKGPFLNPSEMNNPSKESVMTKIAAGPYANLFLKVFGSRAFKDSEEAFENATLAIAAFEKSPALSPFRSKFDTYLRGETSLSALETKGFELFKDPEKGNCLACHVGDESSKNPANWLFTDFTYDNLGVPRNGAIPANQNAEHYDLGLCQQQGLATKAPANFDIESLCGAFKVPTLRNVAITAPYMHNGHFDNLRDVVRFYVTRDTNPELWYPRNDRGEVAKYNDLPPKYQGNINQDEAPYDRKQGESPRLNDQEIDAVVAFLQTLTDFRH